MTAGHTGRVSCVMYRGQLIGIFLTRLAVLFWVLLKQLDYELEREFYEMIVDKIERRINHHLIKID